MGGPRVSGQGQGGGVLQTESGCRGPGTQSALRREGKTKKGNHLSAREMRQAPGNPKVIANYLSPGQFGEGGGTHLF